jgi:hypothetical protein
MGRFSVSQDNRYIKGMGHFNVKGWTYALSGLGGSATRWE